MTPVARRAHLAPTALVAPRAARASTAGGRDLVASRAARGALACSMAYGLAPGDRLAARPEELARFEGPVAAVRNHLVGARSCAAAELERAGRGAAEVARRASRPPDEPTRVPVARHLGA